MIDNAAMIQAFKHMQSLENGYDDSIIKLAKQGVTDSLGFSIPWYAVLLGKWSAFFACSEFLTKQSIWCNAGYSLELLLANYKRSKKFLEQSDFEEPDIRSRLTVFQICLILNEHPYHKRVMEAIHELERNKKQKEMKRKAKVGLISGAMLMASNYFNNRNLLSGIFEMEIPPPMDVTPSNERELKQQQEEELFAEKTWIEADLTDDLIQPLDAFLKESFFTAQALQNYRKVVQCKVFNSYRTTYSELETTTEGFAKNPKYYLIFEKPEMLPLILANE